MSDSGPKNLSTAAGVGLAAAGLIIGLAGPRVLEKVVLKLKPGGKFSGVRVLFLSRKKSQSQGVEGRGL